MCEKRALEEKQSMKHGQNPLLKHVQKSIIQLYLQKVTL